MNKGLAWIGILGTGLYLALIGYLTQDRLIILRTMELNNLGDFLAGAFGPLAILWLILGFFQQGYELRQNNEALKLQADELRNSVNQQKEMVGIAGRQLEAELEKMLYDREQREKALLPNFKLAATVPTSTDKTLNAVLRLENFGSLAEEVELDVVGGGIGRTAAIDTGGKLEIGYQIDAVDGEYPVVLKYKYSGRSGILKYTMKVSVTNPGRAIANIVFVPVKSDDG